MFPGRHTKAFEKFTVRMLFVIAFGTACNLGYLLHLKNSGEFGAHPAKSRLSCTRSARQRARDRLLSPPCDRKLTRLADESGCVFPPPVPLELERKGYERQR